MRRWNDGWLYSPRDLIAVLECEHRLQLEHAVAAGALQRPSSEPDATLELVAAHGDAHEAAAWAELKRRTTGLVVEVPSPGHDAGALEQAAAETRAALAAGADLVCQAALLVDGFFGFADVLTSIDPVTGEPLTENEDGTGRRVYEPLDAKLARSAKTAALLQTASYADALVRLGHPEPRRVHLWLGSGHVATFPAADLLPVVTEYRERVLARLGQPAVVPAPLWGDARPACATCSWSNACDTGRHEERDLSLVAGIRRDQVHRLREQGVHTVEELASATDDVLPPGMGAATFVRLRAQAELQVKGIGEEVPVVDVFDTAPLRALPAPDPGDLYYDIEGDPFAEGGDGLEYLHGVTDAAGAFTPLWADTRTAEKAAFEAVVDRFTAAAAANPRTHVYHYAAYERTALLALAVRHQTREAEVDQLLREGRLVDLFAVVRNSLRASTESYSIKKLEPLYMGDDLRSGDVITAGDSIVGYERYLLAAQRGQADNARRLRKEIIDYNAYDCESTRRLHHWLLAQIDRPHAPLHPPVTPATNTGRATAAAARPADSLVDQLREGVPEALAQRDSAQHARALLAAALGYYAREHKPYWWQHFEHLRTPLDELAADDDVVVLEQVEAGPWQTPTPRARALRRSVTATTRSTAHDVRALGKKPFALYTAPLPDGVAGGADSVHGVHRGCSGVDGRVTFTETLRVGQPGWSDLPVALLPAAPPSTDPMDAVLATLASAVVEGGEPDAAWWRLLTRTPSTIVADSGDVVADVAARLRGRRRDVVAVQGPPGTGKTHVGAHVIAELARCGWRIGVVAQGHQVVHNLLRRVCEVDPALPVAKEPHGADPVPWETPAKLGPWLAGQAAGCVVGGTSWTFAKADVRAAPLDLMVVDEAGQVALVDALVAGSPAKRILLLGDPQQLPHVSQGSHPEPVDVSALRHVLGGAALVTPENGHLLTTTWRMHPDVCAPVSRLQYEGVLMAHSRCAARSLDGVAPGVHLMEVEHHDNRTSSPEEVAAVVARVDDLLGRTWTDEEGVSRPLEHGDVLVVAPFNRQVSALSEALGAAGHGAVPVGTVDKFQGREAPVVIVSMATSSGDELPRGLEFLLSRNRLNVALSRAMWAAYLVHSPELRRLTPTSPTSLVALGAFLDVLRTGD